VYPYFELTVELLDISPRIWRRFLLPTSASFLDLHKAIQAASGCWKDYHLFEFSNGPTTNSEVIAGMPDDEAPEVPEAGVIALNHLFGADAEIGCIYRYDFGDCWRMKVSGKYSELPYKFKRCLLDGDRAFPPEDCGGTDGYDDCVLVATTGEDGDPITGRWLGRWKPDDWTLETAKRKFDR